MKAIDLTKTLSHLSNNKIKELETITQRIADTKKAETVMLFGSYARGNYKEQRGKSSGKISDYDILVVVSGIETKKELISELRGTFKNLPVHVQLIIETIDFVNSNLEERQYFFTDIKREGKVLFNTGNFMLSAPVDLTPTRRREMAEEDFNEWFGMANVNFETFKLVAEKGKDTAIFYRKASFELQQTVEMCCTAIEMVFTHYNPYEHNLETLRERVLAFDSRIKKALPYETKQQQELFDYLNFAYIGGRYRSEDEFPVTKEQLEYWSEEAKKLLDLTAIICRDRIECLKEIESKSR